MEMIEEYMIMANSAVAKQIYDHSHHCACLRRHPLPRTDRFEELIATAALKVLYTKFCLR
jgi:exoribonuclease R